LLDETVHHMLIVDNFMVDINGRPLKLQHPVHAIDGHIDAGTKAAGVREKNFHGHDSGLREFTNLRAYCSEKTEGVKWKWPKQNPQRERGQSTPRPCGGLFAQAIKNAANYIGFSVGIP
jgi:hypothetical protein